LKNWDHNFESIEKDSAHSSCPYTRQLSPKSELKDFLRLLKEIAHLCIFFDVDGVTKEILRDFFHQRFNIALKDLFVKNRFGVVALSDEDLPRCADIVNILKTNSYPELNASKELFAVSLINSNFIEVKQEGEINGTLDKGFYLKDSERLKQERNCIECKEKPKNIVMLPCAHLLVCSECAVPMKSCPSCGKPIQAQIVAFV
jgi:hypothetical protein